MSCRNSSGYSDDGLAVYFSFRDIAKSSQVDVREYNVSWLATKPWENQLQAVLDIARKYKQICIFLWYPHAFGLTQRSDESRYRNSYEHLRLIRTIPARDGDRENPKEVFSGVSNGDLDRYETVLLQEVVPTRTGLNGIRSSAVVWLSGLNYSKPYIPDKVIRKNSNNASADGFYV